MPRPRTLPRPGRAAAVAAVALAAALAGCGSSSDGTASNASSTTTTEASTTSTTAATTSTTAATTTTENLEGTTTETGELDTLPDGEHYGYLAGLEQGTVEGQTVPVIIFDKVDFLTGQAAVDAAHEDGAIPADQDFVENDYYIRNRNQTVRHLAVVPDASVTSLSGGSPDPVPSSLEEVYRQPYLFKITVGNVRGITTVSGIEAVYLP